MLLVTHWLTDWLPDWLLRYDLKAVTLATLGPLDPWVRCAFGNVFNKWPNNEFLCLGWLDLSFYQCVSYPMLRHIAVFILLSTRYPVNFNFWDANGWAKKFGTGRVLRSRQGLDTEKASKSHSLGVEGSRNSHRIRHLMGRKWHFSSKIIIYVCNTFYKSSFLTAKFLVSVATVMKKKHLSTCQLAKKVCYFPYFLDFFPSAHFSLVCVVELVLW